jgi:NTE family protein
MAGWAKNGSNISQMRIIINRIILASLLLLVGCGSVPEKPASPSGSSLGAQPRWALALGGGAARGFAHIGVLQALESAGLTPDLVTGTSAGSLVAALYASGKSPGELQALALSLDELSITDWTLPFVNRGLIRGEALARYVQTQVKGRTLEQMPISLGIVATRLDTGAEVVFVRGDVGLAVRASSAVPAIFQPVRIAGVEYVDGGLVSPVPVQAARQMGASVVVAVDISSMPEGNATGNPIEVILQTTAIMGKTINSYALREADVVVRPDLAGLKSTDFSARLRSIEAGRHAMQALLPELRRKLQAK